MVFNPNINLTGLGAGATLPVPNTPSEQFQKYASGLGTLGQSTALLLSTDPIKERLPIGKRTSEALGSLASIYGLGPEAGELAYRINPDDPVFALDQLSKMPNLPLRFTSPEFRQAGGQVIDSSTIPTKGKKGFFNRLFGRDQEPQATGGVSTGIEQPQGVVAEQPIGQVSGQPVEPSMAEQENRGVQIPSGVVGPTTGIAAAEIGRRFFTPEKLKVVKDVAQKPLAYVDALKKGAQQFTNQGQKQTLTRLATEASKIADPTKQAKFLTDYVNKSKSKVTGSFVKEVLAKTGPYTPVKIKGGLSAAQKLGQVISKAGGIGGAIRGGVRGIPGGLLGIAGGAALGFGAESLITGLLKKPEESQIKEQPTEQKTGERRLELEQEATRLQSQTIEAQTKGQLVEINRNLARVYQDLANIAPTAEEKQNLQAQVQLRQSFIDSTQLGGQAALSKTGLALQKSANELRIQQLKEQKLQGEIEQPGFAKAQSKATQQRFETTFQKTQTTFEKYKAFAAKKKLPLEVDGQSIDTIYQNLINSNDLESMEKFEKFLQETMKAAGIKGAR